MQKSIMLVDDEVLILKTLEKVFRSAGYEVICASSGEEAMSLIDGKEIGIFLLDLNMPGMNGIDLGRKIKEKFPISSLYALTGYTGDFHLDECRNAGFDDYFVKPFKIDQMLKAANDAFERVSRWHAESKEGSQ